MNGAQPAMSDALRLRKTPATALGLLLELQPPLADRLRGCHRTALRVEQLAASRLGPPSTTMTSTQARLLAMDTAALRELSLHAGAVRHARAVLSLIDGLSLRTLAANLGPGARGAALRWRELAAGGPDPSVGAPLANLAARDGLRCLHAWCDRQPSAIGMRVRLLVPPGASAEGEEAALGARIVDALGGEDV